LKPLLTLYLRHDCHLCEAFLAELIPLKMRWQFDIETKDIDSDPELRERYNTLVPVLAIDGQEVCHYFLDPDKLAVYFE
jgi:glutaredoxin